MPTPLTDAWRVVVVTLEHPWLRPVVVFTIWAALATVVRRVGERALRERLGDAHEAREISDALLRPLSTLLLLAGVGIVIKTSDLDPDNRSLLASVNSTLAVLAASRSLFGAISVAVDHASRRATGALSASTAPVLDIAGKVVAAALTVYGVLLAWHVDLTAWIASAGIAGVAVGFAAQETLANLAAGMSILADRPYSIGDSLVLSDGVRGVVVDIGLRSTRLRTLDDVEIAIPNKEMASTRVVNASAGTTPHERVGIEVAVSYGADLERVRAVLLDLPGTLDAELINPGGEASSVRFRSFDDSGITVRLNVHAVPLRREEAVDAVIRAIHRRFAAEGISIPFPQRDVHVIPPPR